MSKSLEAVEGRHGSGIGRARHERPLRFLLFLTMYAALSAIALGAAAQEVSRFPAKGQVPGGYPAQYAATIAAAEKEGKLLIYSTTDVGVAAELDGYVEGIEGIEETRKFTSRVGKEEFESTMKRFGGV